VLAQGRSLDSLLTDDIRPVSRRSGGNRKVER
jgi:hypothetical protein